MKRNFCISFWIVTLLLPALLSCRLVTSLVEPDEVIEETQAPPPEPDQNSADEPLEGEFSAIIFCEDVTDDGECLEESRQFPAGTQRVWAYFTYAEMQDGQSWGRYWTLDGAEYVDATGEAWEDGEEGWVAYSVEGEHGLEGGSYLLTLYLGEDIAQLESFRIESEPEYTVTIPAFGHIDFASELSEDLTPLHTTTEFESGVAKIYAAYAYINMLDGLSWSCEWLWNGEPLVHLDLSWDEGESGVSYCSYENSDGAVLEPGEYTLNLYIEDQIARSATVSVLNPDYQSGEVEPAEPEEVISGEILPAWEMLNEVSFEPLHEIAQLALKYHVTIGIDEEMSWYGGVYHVDDCGAEPRMPGEIYFSREFFNDATWESVAALVGHELVHAMQHMEKGTCGCYLYNEVQAYEAQIYAYKAMGVEERIYEDWGNVFGDDGRFDEDLLWQWVDERYDCPAYPEGE
jgi:hypothetical protein